jgi:hypothetical protein
MNEFILTDEIERRNEQERVNRWGREGAIVDMTDKPLSIQRIAVYKIKKGGEMTKIELKAAREMLEGIEEQAKEVHEEIQALWSKELREGNYKGYERLSDISLQMSSLVGMIKGLHDMMDVES